MERSSAVISSLKGCSWSSLIGINDGPLFSISGSQVSLLAFAFYQGIGGQMKGGALKFFSSSFWLSFTYCNTGWVTNMYRCTSLTMRCEVRNIITEELILSIEKIVFVGLDETGEPKEHGYPDITFERDRFPEELRHRRS